MIGGGIWLAKGPGPAIDGQVEAILPGPDEVVGAIHTVAAHPTDPDTLYVGAANGGIWKTTNATATSPMWTPLTDFETSGSIGALEFDPMDGTHMTLVAGHGLYSSFGQVGGARDGLLKTTDGGATWSSIVGGSSLPTGVNVSGVAPRGSTIVATSNFSTPFTCALGGLSGIWRSTDGGTTFGLVLPPSGPAGVAFDLASDASSTTTLYTGMTFVAGCSAPSGLTNGVYKSTDTGATWSKVSDMTMDGLILDDLPPAMPGTNNIEIAADGMDVFVNIINSGRPVGIFHSSDGGSSWTAMDIPRTPEFGGLISTVLPGAPIVVGTVGAHGLGTGMEVDIAGVTGTLGANGVSTITFLSAVSFSLDGSSDFTAYGGGGTWTKVVGLNPKVKPGSQGGIHAAIRTDPVTPSTVFLGGDRQDGPPFPNFLGALDFSGRLFRGDATVAATGAIPSPQWEHLTHSSSVATIPGGGTMMTSAPHADSREMVFDANGDLIEVDDGGIYRRTFPGSAAGDWSSINGNIQVTEQHDVAYDSLSNIIISGNQDTGTTQQMTENSLTWDSVSTADGGDVAVDDSVSPSIRYSSFQNLLSFTKRTWDAGNGLVGTTMPALTYIGATPGVSGILGNFVTPVELNKVTPTHMVLGGCNAIFESLDMGATIIDIPGLLDTDCLPASILGFSQNAIAYGGFLGAVPNPDVLYVGAGPLLYNRTLPGGISLLPAYPGTETIRDVVLNGSDWKEVFVIESNYTTSIAAAPPFFSKVYWSTDSGLTWTDITGNITDVGLQTLEFVPGAPDRLMAGGRDGVYELTLPPTAFPGPWVWGEIGTGLPNAPVWDMEYDATDNVLVVGTMGRGAWVLQENGACGKPDKLVVNNQWVSGTQLDEACTQITGGPALDVTSTGDLKFTSPKIILDNGFAVKAGGEFEAENAVP